MAQEQSPAPRDDDAALYAVDDSRPKHGTAAVVPADGGRPMLRRRVATHVREWRPVYLAFILSRLLVMAVGFGAEVYARLGNVDPFRPFAHAATYVHYADVVTNGYVYDGIGGAFDNTTEYPLLPSVLWAGQQIGIPLAVTAFILSNLLMLVGLLAIAKIGERYVGRSAAIRGSVYLAILPFSHFFSLASTESWMLAGMAVAVLLALRGTSRSWLGAGALAAVVALSRPPGMLLGLLLLCIAVGQLKAGQLRGRRLAAALAAGVAIPVSVLGFFAYLGVRTGDAFAAMHAQEQFNRSMSIDGPFRAIGSAMQATMHGSPGQAVELIVTFGSAALLVAFATGAAGARWEIRGWTLFAAASLLLPLASGVLYQMPRFALLVPPLVWTLGVVGRRRWFHRTMIVLCPLALIATVVREVIGVAG